MTRPSRLARLLTLVIVGSFVAPAIPGQADDDISDAREKREAALEAEAQALEQVTLLEAADDELAQVVAGWQNLVDAQQADVDRAEQAYADAVSEVGFRLDLIAQAESDILAAQEAARVHAVNAFVTTSSDERSWLTSGDLNQSARRDVLIDVSAGSEQDALDELRTLLSQRDMQRELARAAQADADEFARVLVDELALLEERRNAEVEARAVLQSRIAAWQADADALEQEADDLTAFIKAEQVRRLGFNPGTPGAASVEGFIKPMNVPLGSPFGMRRHPIYRTSRMHTGVDMGAPTGTPIWAAKDGVVIHAGWRGGYGNAVVIQHDGAVSTLYAHMSQVSVSTGDRVAQGDVVGLVGSTGVSTGPHLHFEVRINGEPRDPAAVLPG